MNGATSSIELNQSGFNGPLAGKPENFPAIFYQKRDKTMKLYHGTYTAALVSIRKEGLKPRGNKDGNWIGQNVQSHPDMVYLHKDRMHALFHAYSAATINGDSHGVVLETDLRFLNPENLRVDENFLDWEERKDYALCDIKIRLKQREKAFYDTRYLDSLDKVGMCCHVGVIEPWWMREFHSVPVTENPFYLPYLHTIPDKVERAEAMKVLSGNFLVFYTPSGRLKWQEKKSGKFIKDIVFYKNHKMEALIDRDFDPAV